MAIEQRIKDGKVLYVDNQSKVLFTHAEILVARKRYLSALANKK